VVVLCGSVVGVFFLRAKEGMGVWGVWCGRGDVYRGQAGGWEGGDTPLQRIW